MASIKYVTLETTDLVAGEHFYSTAFELGERVRLRTATEPTSGFRAFTLSLTVTQPADVAKLVNSALEAGAKELKPVTKSFWGYGGIVQAPDGAIWKVATSNKKDTGPATGEIDKVVLLLGVDDMAASKRCYVDHGLKVGKSYGRKYVEFDTPNSPITLALYGRKALAKDAGVTPDGNGSHRITIGTTDADPFTDPDGFTWETTH